MKKILALIVVLLLGMNFLCAQNETNEEEIDQKPEEKLFDSDISSTLHFGGYGQVDYNQDLNNGSFNNGKLDVHRLILFAGYQFNEKTKFVTEIEFEHVKELYIEQAFLSYELTNFMELKGGLILIPMGIINEYHEPPTFNGVERPNTDKYIVPTTWREIGVGIQGRLNSLSLNYQLFLVNGFNGYDGSAQLSGSSGLRGGRQKGAESYISSPNLSAKIKFYGISGLNIGLAGYFGNTQSTMYDGIDKNNDIAVETADSTVVGISMIGFDYRYRFGGFSSRGQLIYSKHSNVDQYNAFTGSDLGESMLGYYIEFGYDLFKNSSTIKTILTPFVRFERYDTHFSTLGNISDNKAFNRTDIFAGVSWRMHSSAVFKVDYQLYGDESISTYNQRLNVGIGVMF